jgi:hypothetical protein
MPTFDLTIQSPSVSLKSEQPHMYSWSLAKRNECQFSTNNYIPEEEEEDFFLFILILKFKK